MEIASGDFQRILRCVCHVGRSSLICCDLWTSIRCQPQREPQSRTRQHEYGTSARASDSALNSNSDSHSHSRSHSASDFRVDLLRDPRRCALNFDLAFCATFWRSLTSCRKWIKVKTSPHQFLPLQMAIIDIEYEISSYEVESR